MIDDDKLTGEFRSRLREAIEHRAERETNWTAFQARLGESVAARLAELRRRASGGHRAAVAAGAAWWDYTARFALAAVPLGLAAAVLLIAYLRSGDTGTASVRPRVAASANGSSDTARAAFESILTGIAAPRAVMGALIPVPPAAFLADSGSGGAR
jgi:hypothetical protein